MRPKAWGALAIVGVFALAVVGQLRGASDGKPVVVEMVSKRQVRASILTSGTLVYERQALLSPEVIGRVEQVLVQEGDRVEAGQLLLVLDQDTLRAEVEQQRAAVAQQRTSVSRQRVQLDTQRKQTARMGKLFAAQLIDAQRNEQERQAQALAEIGLASARESLRQVEAQLQQVQQRLGKASIRAPMAGVVVSLSIKAGETAVPSASGIAGSSLLTIADPTSLITEVNVDEADIPRVRPGQAAAVFAAGDPDAAVNAEVIGIALTPRQAPLGATQGARNYTVKLRFSADTGLTLRPGMSCRAEIYTQTSEATLAVPLQAVLSNNSEDAEPEQAGAKLQHYVFVERDGRAVRRNVRPGLTDDRYQEVIAGLQSGERIVVGPYKLLRHLKAGDVLEVVKKGTVQ